MRVCEEAAEEAREVAEAGCLLLLYFSGHGALQPLSSGHPDVAMFTGGVTPNGKPDVFWLNTALDLLYDPPDDVPGADAGDDCFVAMLDCCQAPLPGVGGSHADPEAPRFASNVLCACPLGDVAPASWNGSFSPYVPCAAYSSCLCRCGAPGV